MTSPAAGRPPLVIGMPVYNGEDFIEEALRSLLDQTYGDFLVLVSDNASSDATRDVVAALAAGDERVRYERLPENIGANGNFNHTFTLAWEKYRPRFFKWAAHDDLCRPDFLARCLEILEPEPEVVLAYPRTVLIDDRGEPIPDAADPGPKATDADPVARFANILADEFGVFYIFGVIRAGALASTTLFGPHWPPDKALASWLALLGRFAQVSEPLFLRRTHAEQSSSMALRDQARWSHPGLGRFVPAPVWATSAYARAVSRAPLTAAQRRQAYGILARKYLDADKWRRVVRPGRDNYLGWHGKGSGDRELVLPPGSGQGPG